MPNSLIAVWVIVIIFWSILSILPQHGGGAVLLGFVGFIGTIVAISYTTYKVFQSLESLDKKLE